MASHQSTATSPSAKYSVHIPEGLTDLLQNFTVAALREQPQDLLLFATNYFQNKLQERCGINEQASMNKMRPDCVTVYIKFRNEHV